MSNKLIFSIFLIIKLYNTFSKQFAIILGFQLKYKSLINYMQPQILNYHYHPKVNKYYTSISKFNTFS